MVFWKEEKGRRPQTPQGPLNILVSVRMLHVLPLHWERSSHVVPPSPCEPLCPASPLQTLLDAASPRPCSSAPQTASPELAHGDDAPASSADTRGDDEDDQAAASASERSSASASATGEGVPADARSSPTRQHSSGRHAGGKPIAARHGSTSFDAGLALLSQQLHVRHASGTYRSGLGARSSNGRSAVVFD